MEVYGTKELGQGTRGRQERHTVNCGWVKIGVLCTHVGYVAFSLVGCNYSTTLSSEVPMCQST